MSFFSLLSSRIRRIIQGKHHWSIAAVRDSRNRKISSVIYAKSTVQRKFMRVSKACGWHSPAIRWVGWKISAKMASIKSSLCCKFANTMRTKNNLTKSNSNAFDAWRPLWTIRGDWIWFWRPIHMRPFCCWPNAWIQRNRKRWAKRFVCWPVFVWLPSAMVTRKCCAHYQWHTMEHSIMANDSNRLWTDFLQRTSTPIRNVNFVATVWFLSTHWPIRQVNWISGCIYVAK